MTAERVFKSVAGSAEIDEGQIPAPLDQVLGYLLRQAHTAFTQHWILSFREKGVPITPVQGGMLILINRNQDLTQAALARMLNVEGPTLLQSLDRLDELGYVQRMPRENDRRSYVLRITPNGKRVLEEVMAFVPTRDSVLLRGISAEERKVLISLLGRIVVRSREVVKGLQNRDSEASPPGHQKAVTKAKGTPASKRRVAK
jgi:DNA-binding MarR family transcriptional regulator